MAIHRPEHRLFQRMLDSVVAQNGVRCRIYAVIDGPAGTEEVILRQLSEAGAEIDVTWEALGVRAAFARALERALATEEADPAAAFAYADQDDVWHPDRLGEALDALRSSGATLVHCDARVVSEAGRVIAPSLHRFERRSKNVTLLDHILINAVTGMTATFTPAVARLAAGLMRATGDGLLHDHVTAVAAAALGDVRWLDRPLVDYVQHDGNVVGAVRRPKTAFLVLFWVFGLGAYRRGSARIYACRRELVDALMQETGPKRTLSILFRTGRPWSGLRVYLRYGLECTRYLLRGRPRHWHLLVRCCDAALFQRT